MVNISDLFDLDEFNAEVEAGYVNVRTHPDDADLWIANYSNSTQFEQRWNPVTMQCRGLIYNGLDGEVIARPFPKFFNWDDSRQPYPPGGQCFVMPKMDGSMGVLYPAPGGAWAVATRGSFISDQAVKATLMFRAMCQGMSWDWTPRMDKTYLFEIIYPENRIVVDYGDQERLVLLDVLDTETGQTDLAEFYSFNWPDKVARKLIDAFSDGLIHEIPQGEEGFVIHWPYQNLRIKMKAAEYLEIHKAVYGLSERRVWEHLRRGGSVASLCEPLPDEFHAWVVGVANRLQNAVDYDRQTLMKEFRRIRNSFDHEPTRKEWAARIHNHPQKGWLFLVLDNKWEKLLDSIWDEVKPAGNLSMKNNSEDVA